MTQMGKIIVVMGVLLVAVGLAMWAVGRSGFRGLPGDIRIQGEHSRFYFPIITCIILSAALTALLWLWRWFRGS